jgi:hypothetical protein
MSPAHGLSPRLIEISNRRRYLRRNAGSQQLLHFALLRQNSLNFLKRNINLTFQGGFSTFIWSNEERSLFFLDDELDTLKPSLSHGSVIRI